MRLFRRDETYNQQMLREAGLLESQQLQQQQEQEEPAEPAAIDWDTLLGKGMGRDELDACVTTTAPGLSGERIRFTTLPVGDAIVEEEQGNGDVSPLADAVERDLEPPYKAFAARQDGDLWAVGAKRIEVAKLELAGADELDLSQNGDERELRLDGEPSDASVPVELERLGERAGADFYLHAERIDGDFWEVKVSAL